MVKIGTSGIKFEAILDVNLNKFKVKKSTDNKNSKLCRTVAICLVDLSGKSQIIFYFNFVAPSGGRPSKQNWPKWQTMKRRDTLGRQNMKELGKKRV